MLRNKAINAHYDRERKALGIDFADGSAGIWPVRLLEMVRYDGNAWVPVEATEAQLEAVELGGEHIYWDELGQDFRISDFKAGIYGREPWMAKIQQQMAMAQPSKGIASYLNNHLFDSGGAIAPILFKP